MENKRLFSRMRGWFRTGSGGVDTDVLSKDTLGENVPGENVRGDPEKDAAVASGRSRWLAVDGPDDSASADRAGDGGAELSSLKPSEARLEKLQDGYIQVIELVETIRKHQDRQDDRAVEFSTSLSQMASTLAAIEKGNKLQVDRLADIADELRVGNERINHWQDVLAEFPKTAQAQREALVGVTKQMEAVGDRDDKMTGSLDSLRDAVTALGDATTASSVAVKNLQMTAIEDSERTADLLESQNKRFTMLFSLTVALALLALIVGGVVYLRGG